MRLEEKKTEVRCKKQIKKRNVILGLLRAQSIANQILTILDHFGVSLGPKLFLFVLDPKLFKISFGGAKIREIRVRDPQIPENEPGPKKGQFKTKFN